MADQKLTQLTEETTPLSTDIIYLVGDPGGTPASKKLSLSNIIKAITGTKAQFNTAVSDGTILFNVVEDATPQWGGDVDVNGFSLGDGTDELLKFVETASAVNELTITNAAAGNSPKLTATGDSAAIGIEFVVTGAAEFDFTGGSIRLANNEGVLVKDTGGTAQLIAYMDAGNNTLYRHNHASGSVYIGTLNGSGTGHVFVQTQGKNRINVSEAGGVLLGDDTSTNATARLELQPTSGEVGIKIVANSANAIIVDNSGTKFAVSENGEIDMIADQTGDTAPTDDTSLKKLTLQRLAADPTNAAFIKFSNSPGSPTNDFYLVLEEG